MHRHRDLICRPSGALVDRSPVEVMEADWPRGSASEQPPAPGRARRCPGRRRSGRRRSAGALAASAPTWVIAACSFAGEFGLASHVTL
jgi:hypothetical protein